MKLRSIIPALILLTITCSCHHDQHSRHHKKHKQKSITNKDTFFVATRSAISIWLDTATMEKRRKQYGDEGYDIGLDDDLFYSSISDSVLRSHHLPVINADGYKYLKFIQSSRVSTVVRIDTIQQLYTLYFFDPSKAPLDADVTDIEAEYNRFYH